MISDELGISLHDKATRGIALSGLEQQQLEQWYAEKDQEEGKALKVFEKLPDPPNLQTRIDTTLIQIGMMAKRLQELVLENQNLREEITTLRQQLITATSYKKAV